MTRLAIAALAISCAIGCGGGGSSGAPDRAPRPSADQPPEPARGGGPEAPVAARLRCEPELANCASARGRIVYVERVDPDGDGDAHFVLFSDQDVTAPGISVIDVERELRPRPLPEPGDSLSAAGPVYRGSHGQLQIQAVELRVARAATDRLPPTGRNSRSARGFLPCETGGERERPRYTGSLAVVDNPEVLIPRQIAADKLDGARALSRPPA